MSAVAAGDSRQSARHATPRTRAARSATTSGLLASNNTRARTPTAHVFDFCQPRKHDGGMEPTQVATTYFESWKRKDFDALRAILADDVTFSGPMGTASGADDYVRQLADFAERLENITVEKMLADDGDVLTWFNLHPKGGDPVPVVNWCHVEKGRAQRVRVVFDPRPLM